MKITGKKMITFANCKAISGLKKICKEIAGQNTKSVKKF